MQGVERGEVRNPIDQSAVAFGNIFHMGNDNGRTIWFYIGADFLLGKYIFGRWIPKRIGKNKKYIDLVARRLNHESPQALLHPIT